MKNNIRELGEFWWVWYRHENVSMWTIFTFHVKINLNSLNKLAEKFTKNTKMFDPKRPLETRKLMNSRPIESPTLFSIWLPTNNNLFGHNICRQIKFFSRFTDLDFKNFEITTYLLDECGGWIETSLLFSHVQAYVRPRVFLGRPVT